MTPLSAHQHVRVAIVGAGPIGLAAAARLAERGDSFVLFEASNRAAGAVGQWSHVRLFTPWRFVVDEVAATLLDRGGWQRPDPEAFPTGGELIAAYLDPLAASPEIAGSLRLNHRVVAITRGNRGKLENDRDDEPFVVEAVRPDGSSISMTAGAVIDASGVWQTPNPIGSNGLPVPGERELAGRISYGPPDVLGSARARFANKRTLVVGSGHSAMNALDDLVRLRDPAPATVVHWALRRDTGEHALSSCEHDELTERTLQRREILVHLQEDAIVIHGGTRITRLEQSAGGIVPFAGDIALPTVDEIIVATGFRPDYAFARELRLDLHHTFECAHELAELIDPELSACGTVPPHGVRRLAHPELDYYVVGAKSYGRAPTFLLLVGYEQVRSIVSAIHREEAAFDVRLELPERGLCSACTAFLDERDAAAGCACTDDDGAECCEDDTPEDSVSVAAD